MTEAEIDLLMDSIKEAVFIDEHGNPEIVIQKMSGDAQRIAIKPASDSIVLVTKTKIHTFTISAANLLTAWREAIK